MSTPSTPATPRPGDIVNGHILGIDGTWQPVGNVSEPEPRNGLGIAALIVGIVGTAAGLVPLFWWFALGMGVTALVLGLVGRGRVKRGVASNGKAALWGAITGVSSIVMGIIGAVIFFTAVNDLSNDLDDISNDLDSYSACVDAIPADLDFDAHMAALEACDR